MAATNFPDCLAFTLRWEGGRSDHPRDPGGRTLNGVTQNAYDADRRARRKPLRDVYLMTPDERDAIYLTRYWNKVNGDHLRMGEDLVVFDYAVNSGPARAHAAFARAAVGDASAEEVAQAICRARLSFMHAIAGGASWKVFGVGWGRRVAACEALAVRMIHGSAASPVLSGKARRAAAATRDAKIKAVAAGAVGTAGGAQPILSGHHWLDVVLFCAVAATIAAFGFKAWRQSQREAAFKAAAANVPPLPREMRILGDSTPLETAKERGA